MKLTAPVDHQTLLAEGKLVQIDDDEPRDVFFLSHQWVHTNGSYLFIFLRGHIIVIFTWMGECRCCIIIFLCCLPVRFWCHQNIFQLCNREWRSSRNNWLLFFLLDLSRYRLTARTHMRSKLLFFSKLLRLCVKAVARLSCRMFRGFTGPVSFWVMILSRADMTSKHPLKIV